MTEVVHGVIARRQDRVRSAAAAILAAVRAGADRLDGALRLFEYEIDASSFLRVRPCSATPGNCTQRWSPIPTTIVTASVTGAIGDDTPSLFQSIEAVGEQPDLAIAMAQIFGGEIDFNTELQPGDRYTIAFERLEREGRPSSYGVITAAEFQNDGRVLRAIRFTPKGGQPGYYDPDGRSFRRFFLRSPLKFEPRVTSGFSARRHAPGPPHGSRTPGSGLRRTDGSRSCFCGVRASSVSHVGRDQRSDGASEARLRLRLALPPLVGVRTGIRAGAASSKGRRLGVSGQVAWRPGHTCTTGCTKNGSVRESAA